VTISGDDTDRLNLLNHRLANLVIESQRLRKRCTSAAVDVRTWPDVTRADQQFMNLPHVRERMLSNDRDH